MTVYDDVVQAIDRLDEPALLIGPESDLDQLNDKLLTDRRKPRLADIRTTGAFGLPVVEDNRFDQCVIVAFNDQVI